VCVCVYVCVCVFSGQRSVDEGACTCLCMYVFVCAQVCVYF